MELSTLTIDQFQQSQSHGLFWDSEIRHKVFELPECKNDTQKFDVSCNKNKFNEKENISIKTSGNTNIDCGDILRFFDRDDDLDITIILIRYNQQKDQKMIREIIEINYSNELKNILFGTITRDILENYVQMVKKIPSGKVSDEDKRIYKKEKKELQQKYNMKINISPKIDSKNQRRVQCSITKLDELFEDYPQFILSRTTSNCIRGKLITSVIDSGKRKRNEKEKCKGEGEGEDKDKDKDKDKGKDKDKDKNKDKNKKPVDIEFIIID